MHENDKKIERLESEIQRMRVAIEELSILNDIATAITSTQSIQSIIDLIVKKCVKHLRVEQGAVMLLNEGDQSRPFRTMVRKQDSVVDGLPYHLDTQLTGWMIKNKTALMTNDFQNDKRFKWPGNDVLLIQSVLCVPMMVKGRMIGLIAVFNKKHESQFSIDDQRLLSIIAAQSAHVIENARLYEEEQSLIRFQEEMRLAKDIQVRLLPSKTPQIEGYQLVGKSQAAKDVGGDYFDFIPVDENRIAFCLGDVSGKGIPASLLMASLQATLRAQTPLKISSKECLGRSNHLLYQSTDAQKYATLFYAILDFKNHEMIYCNAGHDNPYLISHDGQYTRLKTGGIPQGFMPSFDYEEEKVALKPDDVLVLYSDGITEAMNENEEEFGEERLEVIIKNRGSRSAEELVEVILTEIEAHVGQAPQMDDQTLVVLKRQ